MNDSYAMRRRLLKYIVPVFLLSVVFNLPKFFEAEVGYAAAAASGVNATIASEEEEEDQMSPEVSRRYG